MSNLSSPETVHPSFEQERQEIELVDELNAQLDDSVHLPNGGVSMRTYEGGVESIETVRDLDCKYGDVTNRLVTMEDGTRYSILTGDPYELKSDTIDCELTAWWTHPMLEHNLKSFKASLYLGHAAVLIGPPTGFTAKNVSLSKAAYDAHRQLDGLIPILGKGRLNPDNVSIKGDSRGAMAGIAMSAPHLAFDRIPGYIDATAPCVPRPFTLKEWPSVVWQVKKEGLSALQIAKQYGERGQLISLLKSLSPDDPSHVLNALKIFPGLISGAAGRLADAGDPSTAIHIVEGTQDFWSLSPEWKKKYESRENVEIKSKVGTHIGVIALQQTRRNKTARLARIDEIRGFDGDYSDIDFKNDVFTVEADPEVKKRTFFGVAIPSRHKAAA